MSFIDTGGGSGRFLTRAQNRAITIESAPRSSKKLLPTGTRSASTTSASTPARTFSRPAVGGQAYLTWVVDSARSAVKTAASFSYHLRELLGPTRSWSFHDMPRKARGERAGSAPARQPRPKLVDTRSRDRRGDACFVIGAVQTSLIHIVSVCFMYFFCICSWRTGGHSRRLPGRACWPGWSRPRGRSRPGGLYRTLAAAAEVDPGLPVRLRSGARSITRTWGTCGTCGTGSRLLSLVISSVRNVAGHRRTPLSSPTPQPHRTLLCPA